MRQLLNEMPKSVYYQQEYVRETTVKQSTKYNNACHTLYLLDFSSSPCYFDKREVLKALMEYDPDTKPYLTSAGGFEVGFTVGRCKYAAQVFKEIDPILFRVFHAIHRVLEAEQTLKDLEMVATRSFNKVGKHHTSHSIVLTPLVKVRGRYPELANPFIWDCVGLCHENYITKVPYTPLLHKLLAKFLGVEEETYRNYQQNNKALFLKDISFEDEVELAPYLLEGDINVNGAFSAEYRHDYYAYLASDPTEQGVNMEIPKFSSFVLSNTVADYYYYGESLDKQQKSRGRLPLIITPSEIWYYTPSSTKRTHYLPSTFEVGSFFTINGESGMYSYYNQLLGYGGEFFRKENLGNKKYEIKLDVFNKNEVLLPNTVIRNKKTQDGIYTQAGTKGYELNTKDLNRFLRLQRIKQIDDFQLLNKLDDLTLHLTKTLLCIIFDTTLKGYDTPYEVRFNRLVTEEEYVVACQKVAQLVGNLGIR